MEYKIVRMGRDEDLVIEVNAKLEVGWELVGGVGHSGQAFFQAMTLEVEDKPIEKPKAAVVKKPSPKRKRVKAGGTANVKDA